MASVKRAQLLLIITLLTIIASAWYATFLIARKTTTNSPTQIESGATNPLPRFLESPTPTAQPTPVPVPESYVIPQRLHVFQTFNNCGPASLSMQLSYHDKATSQQELGASLRPYQHPTGNNDDKSVTLPELALEAQKYGLQALYRPNGSSELLMQLIAADLPVVVRTWLKAGEDIGHYRVIRGYSQVSKTFIQDDSLQGNNLSYSFEELDRLWQPFNYEYLVLYPAEKSDQVSQIVGEEMDEQQAWENSEKRILEQLELNPEDIYAKFNLSVTRYYLGNYQGSVEAFEQVQGQLPPRTLWYQIEPLISYFELERYETVEQLADKILNNQNRAFSELYFLKGQIREAEGNTTAARIEYQRALQYNTNYRPAKDALTALN